MHVCCVCVCVCAHTHVELCTVNSQHSGFIHNDLTGCPRTHNRLVCVCVCVCVCEYYTRLCMCTRSLYLTPPLHHDHDLEVGLPARPAKEVSTLQAVHLLLGVGQHAYVAYVLSPGSGCCSTCSCGLGLRCVCVCVCVGGGGGLGWGGEFGVVVW